MKTIIDWFCVMNPFRVMELVDALVAADAKAREAAARLLEDHSRRPEATPLLARACGKIFDASPY